MCSSILYRYECHSPSGLCIPKFGLYLVIQTTNTNACLLYCIALGNDVVIIDYINLNLQPLASYRSMSMGH